MISRLVSSGPLLTVLTVILAGCGGGPGGPGGGGGGTKPSCSISVNPPSISSGQSSKLSWSTNGTSATDPVGGSALSGSQTVSPAKDSTYTLTSSNSSGTSSCSATLSVSASTISIVISPASVSVQTGATQKFSATVSGTSNTSVAWIVLGGTANGTIDATGLYTAPASVPNPATISVVATSAADNKTTGTASVTITGSNKWTVGNGSFTSLQFTAAIPSTDRTYITNLFNQAYPVAVAQQGPPPDTSVLSIDLRPMGSMWDASTHTLYMNTLPSTPGISQDFWNLLFFHELSHGMLHSQYTGIASSWIAEGYADAAALAIQRVLGLSGPGFFLNEIDYDVLRMGGPEIVGGAGGRVWRPNNLYGASLSGYAGKALFRILIGTQTAAAAGDWQNYTALKQLKAALYSIANQCQCVLQDTDFFTALATAFPQAIEGQLPDQWVPVQPIANTQGTPGTYAFVYVAPVANPQYLEIVAFTRSNQPLPGAPAGTLQETTCTSGTLNITIANAAGIVQQNPFDLSSASHELNFNTSAYAKGSYRIQASGTCNGVSVTAPDSYFGVFDGALVPAPQDISTLPNAFFLIGRNLNGTPSAKVIPAPTGGAPGQFLENGNGAAIWQVNGSTIPQPEYTLLGRRLYVPLPCSPVFVVDNP